MAAVATAPVVDGKGGNVYLTHPTCNNWSIYIVLCW
jgi:hypothetical protein